MMMLNADVYEDANDFEDALCSGVLNTKFRYPFANEEDIEDDDGDGEDVDWN